MQEKLDSIKSKKKAFGVDDEINSDDNDSVGTFDGTKDRKEGRVNKSGLLMNDPFLQDSEMTGP